MINASTISKNNPFLLAPAGKDYLWGGQRLKDDFLKEIDMQPLAETWECSVHPEGTSVVASGLYRGKLLSKVLEEHTELLGSHHEKTDTIPILVKLIDASKDLSIQVHPDDAYAAEYENGQLGKTEMWYVLDATQGAFVIYGLHHSTDQEEFRESIKDGSVVKYLQRVSIHKGDRFLIRPGTIHTIGAGTLIAEIQENSNLTYRLFDYNRTDQNGQKRPLHVDKALEVANLNAMPEPRQPMHIIRYAKGCASESLCRCEYFQVDRLLVNTEQCQHTAFLQTDSLSFQVLLCIGGCGVLAYENEKLPFSKGDCVFLPASSPVIYIHGNAELLKIIC